MADNHHIEPVHLVRTVKETVQALRRLKRVLGFEQIVCTGISGQSIAWPVSYVTGIPVCVLRRKYERGHHGYDVENFKDDQKYIILDDFISEGNTVKHIIKSLKGQNPKALELCTGIYCYSPAYTDHVTVDWVRLYMYDKARKKRREATM